MFLSTQPQPAQTYGVQSANVPLLDSSQLSPQQKLAMALMQQESQQSQQPQGQGGPMGQQNPKGATSPYASLSQLGNTFMQAYAGGGT